MSEPLQIDPEFRALIPPLTTEERTLLEEGILRDGILAPLVVWRGQWIVLDGHNRLEIAQKHNLDYEVVEVDCADRETAKEWIIRNQLGRRNLQLFQRAELALLLEPYLKEKAKERQLSGLETSGKRGRKVLTNSSEPIKTSHSTGTRATRAALAAAAGVSEDTIAKAKVIQEKATEEIKTALRSGETTLNKEYHKIKGAEAPPMPAKEATKEKKRTLPVLGPPQNGMRFARMAILDLEQITTADVERIQAFNLVKGWLETNDK
jgi:ParB-like chromosome segregation protein Spo0J